MANCKCKTCQIYSKLDAERFDLSYKNFGKETTPQPEDEPTQVPKRRRTNDDRDKLMFNAGRYAGGARDKAAIDANKIFQLLMDTE
jgi:hypothetical protein